MYFVMDIKQLVSIGAISSSAEDQALTGSLVERMDLTLAERSDITTPYFLAYQQSRLSLFETESSSCKPLCVDFLSKRFLYRHRNDHRIDQPLAKAVGIRRGYRPTVCDVTAGFGEDGFVLATLGCPVVLIERSPIVWALLDDGLKRAAESEVFGEVVAQRLTLHCGDSTEVLASLGRSFETVFADPMYPKTSRTALNKREMRVLRNLVGSDPDSHKLLPTARSKAEKRVVVKRPRSGAFLDAAEPSYSIRTGSGRYDIYLSPTCDTGSRL